MVTGKVEEEEGSILLYLSSPWLESRELFGKGREI